MHKGFWRSFTLSESKAMPAKVAALLLFLTLIGEASAQSPFTLTSTDNGSGLFTYTFTPVDASYVMGAQPGVGQISIPSYGVLSYTTPAGWTASVDNDIVTWQPLSGPIFVGSPSLSFSIQSSSTQSALYSNYPPLNGPYSAGLVAGVVYFLPDYQEGDAGFYSFSFTGPAVIPEPSAIALFLLAAGLVRSSRKLLRSASSAKTPSF